MEVLEIKIRGTASYTIDTLQQKVEKYNAGRNYQYVALLSGIRWSTYIILSSSSELNAKLKTLVFI